MEHKEFKERTEAEQFACQKVKEMWVVHLRPSYGNGEIKEGWVVTWWCQ